MWIISPRISRNVRSLLFDCNHCKRFCLHYHVCTAIAVVQRAENRWTQRRDISMFKDMFRYTGILNIIPSVSWMIVICVRKYAITASIKGQFQTRAINRVQLFSTSIKVIHFIVLHKASFVCNNHGTKAGFVCDLLGACFCQCTYILHFWYRYFKIQKV